MHVCNRFESLRQASGCNMPHRVATHHIWLRHATPGCNLPHRVVICRIGLHHAISGCSHFELLKQNKQLKAAADYLLDEQYNYGDQGWQRVQLMRDAGTVLLEVLDYKTGTTA